MCGRRPYYLPTTLHLLRMLWALVHSASITYLLCVCPQVLLDPVEVSWQLLILITTANFPDVMMPGCAPPFLAAINFMDRPELQ